MGKRELIALLNFSSWCLVMVERLFLAVPRGCLPFVIVVFPDHTHLLFLKISWLRRVMQQVVRFCSVVSYEKNGKVVQIHTVSFLFRCSLL